MRARMRWTSGARWRSAIEELWASFRDRLFAKARYTSLLIIFKRLLIRQLLTILSQHKLCTYENAIAGSERSNFVWTEWKIRMDLSFVSCVPDVSTHLKKKLHFYRWFIMLLSQGLESATVIYKHENGVRLSLYGRISSSHIWNCEPYNFFLSPKLLL